MQKDIHGEYGGNIKELDRWMQDIDPLK